ncbi:MAG: hypothetical protein UU26_C0011G0001, partial [Candidatus Daviesbacteria bacterium GW2011_GWC1_40_9]
MNKTAQAGIVSPLLLLALAAMGVLSFILVTQFAPFQKTEVAQLYPKEEPQAQIKTTGSGAPSGTHYNLNIIGAPKGKTASLTESSGHRIFVPLTGSCKIKLSMGDFAVLDGNCTDGIKNGDEVLCPTLTYIATANSILYVGAKPVFLDCQKDTWNIDPAKIEEKITKKTKAIIIVHLYGHSCDMEDILKIAKKHNLYVIEDSAEALGSKYLPADRQGKEKMCGSFGDIATFSFFGNKVITSGEGGMVVTNNDELAKKVALLKNQGMDTNKRYWHPVLGYNYRLTNVQSAIGLAQLENIGKFILKRRRIAKMYSRYLKNIEGITLSLEKDYTFHSYWMYCILIEKEYGVDRDRLMSLLEKQGIQTRPFFYPIHT